MSFSKIKLPTFFLFYFRHSSFPESKKALTENVLTSEKSKKKNLGEKAPILLIS